MSQPNDVGLVYLVCSEIKVAEVRLGSIVSFEQFNSNIQFSGRYLAREVENAFNKLVKAENYLDQMTQETRQEIQDQVNTTLEGLEHFYRSFIAREEKIKDIPLLSKIDDIRKKL